MHYFVCIPHRQGGFSPPITIVTWFPSPSTSFELAFHIHTRHSAPRYSHSSSPVASSILCLLIVPSVWFNHVRTTLYPSYSAAIEERKPPRLHVQGQKVQENCMITVADCISNNSIIAIMPQNHRTAQAAAPLGFFFTAELLQL